MRWKHRLNIAVTLSTLLIILLFFRNIPYPWLWIFLVISSFCVLVVFGIIFLRFQYFYPTIFRNVGPEVILTFDDGPDPVQTPRILDILQKHGVKAIFFVIGIKAQEHPELLQRAISEGHSIGNHTQNHSLFFAMLHSKKIAEEIDTFTKNIEPLVSEKITIFRPPIGYTNPKIARALRRRRFKIVAWSVRSYDSFKNRESLLNRLMRIKPSSIVLLHDNLEQTADILDEFITKAKAKGIVFANQENLKKFIYEINK